LVNEYVTVSEMISRKNMVIKSSRSSENTTLETLFPIESPADRNTTIPKRTNQFYNNSQGSQVQPTQGEYWLNTKSGVRHNKSCRWYGNTKNGRPCGSDEGRSCGQCGG
jgi:hypothetical protein